MTDTVKWIALDWGTSNLRLWAIGPNEQLVGMRESQKGMGVLEPEDFEPALVELAGPFLRQDQVTPVIACGMVGARQGWVEAAYVPTPCPPPGVSQATRAPTSDPRIAVSILPGVSQASPADVMRGEETQIAGYMAQDPEFDGVLCLPGTHTKWVHISAGEIVSFRTFMTGELYASLSRHSVLRHSVQSEGWDDAAFLDAADDAMGAPQRLASRLFGLRAGSLLNDTPSSTARSRLSGLLVGLEIAGAKDYWLGRNIVLIGSPVLTGLYANILTEQGNIPRQIDGAEIVLTGLQAAFEGAGS